MLSKSATRGVVARPVVPALARRCQPVLCRAAQQDSESRMALPLAALVAAAMLTGSAIPSEALAAKSSGRVGGTSGFKSRKMEAAAPSQQQTTVINNTTVLAPAPVMAPPLIGGFGYGGFGYSFMPSFVLPFPFMGGILQIFLVVTVVSIIFNVIKGVFAATVSASKKNDDGWGDL
ncbi:hypothetical protein V8C86DRAFT_2604551 [Haematococcus lacustris]|uniref:Uncharacterized protein n=1 Tax=Haematococcus lacustris TaxID=44745 RepID=A0A699ZYG1_HAELA|nr:hypothetical protein QJQ45_015998 [Haematococcus lacustris]GFH23776.1 uncharacterized protein HaLaN_21446 [Haematococcus lacustris]